MTIFVTVLIAAFLVAAIFAKRFHDNAVQALQRKVELAEGRAKALRSSHASRTSELLEVYDEMFTTAVRSSQSVRDDRAEVTRVIRMHTSTIEALAARIAALEGKAHG